MSIAPRYPKPHPQTTGRVIDGEAVLLMADMSENWVLNPVGSRIFELSDGTRSIEEIIARLADEYDVPPDEVARDTIHFLDELVARKVMIYQDKKER